MRRSPYHCFCTVHCRARVGEPNERGESSPLRSATRTCTSACAPASDQRIWRFLAMRRLTTWLTADSAMLLLIAEKTRNGL